MNEKPLRSIALAVAALLLSAGGLFTLSGCGQRAGAAGQAAVEEACEIRPPVEAGQVVGDLVLRDGLGGSASVAEMIDGKIAVVDVWAMWCPPCIKALPHLEKLHNQFSARGFTVVGVLVDSNAESVGPGFVQKQEIGYPVLFDDDGDRMMCDWGEFYAVPTIFIVDRDGTVLDVFSGVGDINAIDRRLERLFGEPVDGSKSAIL